MLALQTFRRFTCALILCAGVALAVGAKADTAQEHILVLGDSLSAAYGMAEREGWVALLDQRLTEQGLPWRVHNASISGETTAGGLARLPAALDAVQPQVVVIALGGNDGLRGLSLRAMRNHLSRMIEYSQVAGAQVVLLGIEIPPNYGPQYTERFRAVFAELAAETGVAFLPFMLEGVALVPDLMLDDGIHPAPAGQPIILESVWSVLEPLLVAANYSVSVQTPAKY